MALRLLLLLAVVLAAAAGAAFGEAPAGELYTDDEAYTHPDGLVHLERPSREWAFIDVEVQRRRAASHMTGRELEASFRGVVTRLSHPGIKATLSVFVLDLPAGRDLASVEAGLRRDMEARGGRVSAASRARLSRREVLRSEAVLPLEGVRGLPDGDYYVSRIDCLRPELRKQVILILEVPLPAARSVQRDYRAILQTLRL